MDNLITDDFIIALFAAMIVTFFLGIIAGGVLGVIAVLIVYVAREPRAFPIELFLGGCLGLTFGAIGAVICVAPYI